MLSQTVEYSLRAIVWLAAHADDPQTTQQIAAATLVPAGYLAKVMQSLGRGGLVTAQRGKRGGFLLARPAEEVSVLEVINTVEPIQRIRECPLGIAAHGSAPDCPASRGVIAAGQMAKGLTKFVSWAGFLPVAWEQPDGVSTSLAMAGSTMKQPGSLVSLQAVSIIGVALVLSALWFSFRELRLTNGTVWGVWRSSVGSNTPLATRSWL